MYIVVNNSGKPISLPTHLVTAQVLAEIYGLCPTTNVVPSTLLKDHTS